MKFELPRRHRKSYEAIAKRKIDENLNKEESLEIFDKIKKSTTTRLEVLVQTLEKKK